jgi:hypothetical protein
MLPRPVVRRLPAPLVLAGIRANPEVGFFAIGISSPFGQEVGNLGSEEAVESAFLYTASEDSNLNTNEAVLSHGRGLNGMNAMRFGSPRWTRFELLRPS